MNFTKQIASNASAEQNKNYDILKDDNLIGKATFLKKKGDEFTFEIKLFGNRKPEDYEFMFDLDKESHELVNLRAIIKSSF